MAKFGAILAQGVIDAGGRNVTISLQSRTGHTNMAAVVGIMVFCQFWFWYPLSHFMSLAFTPTSIIGLNTDLKMPKIEFRSNAKPSTFAYPPPLEEKKDKSKEKVETAVLSITAKQKKKDAEKAKDKEEKMEVDEEKKDSEKEKEDKEEKDMDTKEEKEKEKEKDGKEKDKDGKEKEGKEGEEEKKKKEPEPNFQMLANPARVMRSQLKVVQMPEGCRYKPLKDVTAGGILMLKDSTPTEKEEIIEPIAAGGPKVEEDEEEPEPPEPFEWTEDWAEP